MTAESRQQRRARERAERKAAKTTKPWTAAGAARAARDARVGTVRFLREAPIARTWQASKLLSAFQALVAHLRTQADARTARAVAATLLSTGMGYSETWRPGNWVEAAETLLTDEADALAEADLYVLSPQMCDVVIAAAQTLTRDDLSLITEDDLPSRCGLLVLPHPLLVKAINGNLGDDRGYHWHTPVQMVKPDTDTGTVDHVAAVRISLYHDSHGPVRPDSFLELQAAARSQGTPLPALLLDAVRCIPFGVAVSDEQRRNLAAYATAAQQTAERARDVNRQLGFEEERVIGEYTPGSEIDDPDDSFTSRFLYAFWRLCDQRIATTSTVEVRHPAGPATDRTGMPPEVRVVQLRPTSHSPDNPTQEDADDRWHHRWVVKMHKVRQWYPSEQRHKVIYRGPYLKGPDDKPLLGGEVVRGLVR